MRWKRLDLEALVANTNTQKSRNMRMLYYTATSGLTQGDGHDMKSLLDKDCLARLVDALVSKESISTEIISPDTHFARSWSSRRADRMNAELGLGHHPVNDFQKSWTKNETLSDPILPFLFDVPDSTGEFENVNKIFMDSSAEHRHYVEKVQRIQQPGILEQFNTRHDELLKNMKEQGIAFEGGTHIRWLFHGSPAINEIISNPIDAFKIVAAGTVGQIWGKGSYFARDAEYPILQNFAPQESADGSRRMLLCLVFTGIVCAGDPDNSVMPTRFENVLKHKYHSSVDYMCDPKIHVINHENQILPAYVITCRPLRF